ncbi:unnamed protein product [Rotaria sp. Silwood1]|nr:unnamed protein product [Rotaria sp. Silwood1]
MWLLLSPEFEEITFRMRFNNFSLKFILNSTSIQVLCSHADDLQTQTRIKVLYRRWFHMILTCSSKFLFYINGNAYSLHCTEEPFNANRMFESVIDNEHDRYMILSYKGHIKFSSEARVADIQVLPCALTPREITAIVEQRTCIEQLNMGRYLLDHWANLHWYWRYASRCILF